MDDHTSSTGIFKHLQLGVKHAFQGFGGCLRYDRTFRLVMAAVCIFLPMSLIMQMTVSLHIFLVMAIFAVLMAELVRVAINRIADQLTFGHPEHAHQIRSIGNAMVLIALLFAVFVWLSVLFWWK